MNYSSRKLPEINRKLYKGPKGWEIKSLSASGALIIPDGIISTTEILPDIHDKSQSKI